jgi:pSer/pThr/pTyr-binding forkhead associated (FHA) protein
MSADAEAFLVGLDLNASRARAVGGPAGAAEPLALEDRHADLPLALSLEGEPPAVGRAGLRICRRLPHLVWVHFLPHVGEPAQWGSGRGLVDAAQALLLVFETLRRACGRARALTLALPAYVGSAQAAAVLDLAAAAGLPVAGALLAPLAGALAAHTEQPAIGPVLVVDADGYALTATIVVPEDGWARLAEIRYAPHLGWQAWKECLLTAVADRCVRQSRRDPRDSALAEQALYDQLDATVEAARVGRLAELVVETPTWYQNLILRPDEVTGFCAPLLRQTLEVLAAVRSAAGSVAAAAPALLTASAARLPGLAAALDDRSQGVEGSLDDASQRRGVQVLPVEALARAAHEVAAAFCRGEVPAGALDAVPLPPPQPVDAGPARLHFHGHDYVLRGRPFLLGHHPTCDLVFNAERYPAVAARHCEILYRDRSYVLRDRGQAAWVNGRPVVGEAPLRPGDWVRLGPDGPLLRFLGRPIALADDPRSAANG